jgi:two-component system, OmpR family, alkaline phosphatase synthesis response regulator PhoP
MANKKILVVDDEIELRLGVVIRLKAAGFEVLTASDGLEGLEKARKEEPDLILLDLMLPKMDGYKVCRMLKFDAKYKNIPIIMLTARAQDTDKSLGGEAGANAYITKPADHQELLDKIKELLNIQ